MLPNRRDLPDFEKLNFVLIGAFTSKEDLVYYSWRDTVRAGVLIRFDARQQTVG